MPECREGTAGVGDHSLCTMGTGKVVLEDMQVYAIPVEDKFILYRPLLKLAFIGNQAMARLVLNLADPEMGAAEAPPAILDYLESIGFMEPDPPPPSPRDPEYRPTSAVILSTSRCNLRCVYCYANAGEETAQDVSVDLARTVVDHAHRNAAETGQRRFELTFHGGGEPTLAWETLEGTVEHARAKDLPCTISLVSNGLWTEERRSWILANIDRLTISFDGGQETQNHQRPFPSGRGSFEATMETLAALDRQGFDYGIRMTALAPWQDRLARDVEFICEETGCRRIQVEPAFNQQRGEYRSPSGDESQDFCAAFMEAFGIAKRYGRRLSYSGARPLLLTSTFCSAPFGSLVVTPAGNLVTCYEVTGPQHPLAGLCTVGRIEDGQVVVYDQERRTLLDRLAARHDSCRDCFCTWHCAGDCHVKVFYPGVDATPETSPRCRTNRTLTAQMLLSFIADSEDGVWRGRRREGD